MQLLGFCEGQGGGVVLCHVVKFCTSKPSLPSPRQEFVCVCVCVCVCVEEKVLEQRFFKHVIDMTEISETSILQNGIRNQETHLSFLNEQKYTFTFVFFISKKFLFFPPYQMPVQEHQKYVPYCLKSPA